ncbi:hypothetical protein EON79_10295 [bacterium]|nr:MAG: hypothetical protein EON79_10295 [bacterium]
MLPFLFALLAPSPHSAPSERELPFPRGLEREYEYASLLLSGESGIRELLRRLEGKDVQARAAAASTLLDSGDPRFLPRIIGLWSDDGLRHLSDEAISRNRKAAWPVLLQKAREGDALAIERISWYGDEGRRAMEELIASPHGGVRAEVVRRETPEARTKALGDPDQRVVDVVVTRLLSSSIKGGKSLDPLFFHPNPRVRTAAVHYVADDGQVYLPAYIRLAKDVDPLVRRGALFQLGRIGYVDNSKSPVREGLLVVERALARGSKSEREAALWAVRGWTDDWSHIAKRWTPDVIERALGILRRKDVRDALYAASSERIQGFGEVFGEIVSTPPVLVTLAISGDPRLFEALQGTVRRQRGLLGDSAFLEIFFFLPRSQSWPYLEGLVEGLLKKPIPKEQIHPGFNDDEPPFVVLQAMARLDPHGDVDRLVRLAQESKLPDLELLPVIRGLALFHRDSVLAYIECLALDPSKARVLRVEAVYALEISKNPKRIVTLQRISAGTTDVQVKGQADQLLIDIASGK